MRVPLAYGQSEQSYPFLAKNSIAEKGPAGMVARCRPGLVDHIDLGTLHVRGILCKAGIFDGDLVVVAGTEVHRVTSNGVSSQISGTAISGSDRVTMDAGLDIDGNAIIRVATGSGLYKITESAVSAEDFPAAAGAGASDVTYLKGYWIAAEAGTDAAYVLPPGETTWDPLEFASAEYGADPLVGVRAFGDYIYLLGSATTETWYLTGDAANLIAPVSGLRTDFGCRARDSIARLDDALIWVDDDCQVRMTRGGQAEVVSEEWLQSKIASVESISLRAWSCTFRQHPLYVMTLGSVGTFVYDLAASLWSEWTSKDHTFFQGHIGTQIGTDIYTADAALNSGIIWRLSEMADDDDGDEIEFLNCYYQERKEGREAVFSAVLDCELGSAPLTGQGSSPLVGLRWSDDRGKSWSNWQYRSLGQRGHYTKPPRWNRLGQVESPFGRIYQTRTTDPVLRVVYGLDVNV